MPGVVVLELPRAHGRRSCLAGGVRPGGGFRQVGAVGDSGSFGALLVPELKGNAQFIVPSPDPKSVWGAPRISPLPSREFHV